jgi:hypothetical protein
LEVGVRKSTFSEAELAELVPLDDDQEEILRRLLKMVPRDTFVPSWDVLVAVLARTPAQVRPFFLGRLTLKELECFEHSEHLLLHCEID